jgi:hypothetical protein
VLTAFDESMAPPRCDTFWFWTGLTPSDPHEPRPEAKKKITETVIRDAAHYYEGIESLEVARRDLALPDIEERFWGHRRQRVPRRSGDHEIWPRQTGRQVRRLPHTGARAGMPGQNAAKTMLKHFSTEVRQCVVERIRDPSRR